MTDRHSHHHYADYQFEDFLEDDYFIKHIIDPDAESLSFWENLCVQNLIDTIAYRQARQFILQIRQESEEQVSATETSFVWNRIQESNKKTSQRKKTSPYKKLYIPVSAAAAAIAVIVVLFHYTQDADINTGFTEQLSSYVENNSLSVDELTETQLIVSRQKTVEIKEKESVIEYDTAQIIISSQETIEKAPAEIHQLVVPKGRRSQLRLIDGTLVHVNAGTILYYPTEFEENKREIYVNGEAFFNVTHDANRPFIVHTSGIDVEVLGTKFNVMAYDTDKNKQIVLTEGSVKVLSKQHNTQTILEPCDMFEISEAGENTKKVDTNYFTSWVDGLYLFERERLDVVMLRLSRYYGKDISFDAEIANLKCSGKMDLKEHLDEILSGLAFMFPINIAEKDEKYYITKRHI